MNAQAPDVEGMIEDAVANFIYDPYGYVMFAFPWGVKGGPLEHHEGPDDWQREQLMSIAGSFLTDPGGTIQDATASGHGIGKFLSVKSTIYTPSGAKAMGDVRVGDEVFSAEGEPTKVTGVYPQGRQPLYRVRFSDGSSVLAGLPHLWEVTTRDDRHIGRPPKVVTTEEMIGNLKRRYQIPVTQPVQFAPRDVSIDPYTMGYVIGNGSLCTPGAVKVSCFDPEVYERIAAALPKGYSFNGCNENYQHISTGAYSCQENLLHSAFAAYGMTGVKADRKRIPEDYLHNSVECRVSLLRGLMDADGCISKRKGRPGYRVLFCTSSEALRDQVVWLVQSLGGVAGFSVDDRRGKAIDVAGAEGVNRHISYQITINLPDQINPFHISRKADAYRDWVATGVKRAPIRAVDSIEYECDEEAVCIAVDNPRHLYLTDEFIVTHNTAEVAWVILWAMSTRPHLAGWVTSNTKTQLTTKTWREVSVWHQRAINSHWFEWTATRFYHTDHKETWGIDAIPWSEHNSEAFAGLHADHVLMIMDEASGIADVIWEVASGAMTTPGAMWFAYGNPTKNTGRFRECFGKARHRWRTRQIDSRTCKMTNKAKIQEWVDDNGEDSDYVRVRVRGQFPRFGTSQLISGEQTSKARETSLTADEYVFFNIVIGVDVARFGQDETVITVRQGRKVLEQKFYRGLNNIQVGGRVTEVYRSHGSIGTMLVDEVGLGAGVVDYLMTAGYPVIGVNAGARADDDKRYYNKRAEMWHRMAEWFQGTVDIPNDPVLADQCAALEYQYDLKERIKLETKDDLKVRLPELGSPDRADSLALTFAEIIMPGQTQDSFEPEEEGMY